MEEEDRERGRGGGRHWKGGGRVITSVCLEVKEINRRLIGGYGSANDKSIADNASIVP